MLVSNSLIKMPKYIISIILDTCRHSSERYFYLGRNKHFLIRWTYGNFSCSWCLFSPSWIRRSNLVAPAYQYNKCKKKKIVIKNVIINFRHEMMSHSVEIKIISIENQLYIVLYDKTNVTKYKLDRYFKYLSFRGCFHLNKTVFLLFFFYRFYKWK